MEAEKPKRRRSQRRKDYVKIRELLFGLLSEGNYIETACKLVSMDKDTYYRWLKRAPRGYPANDFKERMDQAGTMAEVEAVKTIKTAVKVDWKAALAFLERRFSERWGRTEKMSLDHSGTIETNQKTELSLSEQTKQFVIALARLKVLDPEEGGDDAGTSDPG